jgi:hypothetical protein
MGMRVESVLGVVPRHELQGEERRGKERKGEEPQWRSAGFACLSKSVHAFRIQPSSLSYFPSDDIAGHLLAFIKAMLPAETSARLTIVERLQAIFGSNLSDGRHSARSERLICEPCGA